MRPEEVDRALERVGAEFDRIAQRLVALDSHPGHRILDSATLVGDSRQRWADAKATIAQLWAQFEAYREVLSTAREIRARRARPSADELAELTRLLRGRSVELPTDATDAGAALTAAHVERITVAELVGRMITAYQPVFDLVTRAAEAWSALAGRLDPMTERLTRARSAAASLGVADSPELAAVEAQLATLRTEALSDPLAQPGDLDTRLDATAGRLDRLLARLAEMQRLRERYPAVRAELARRIDEVVEAEAEEAGLRDTVALKIAGPAMVAGVQAAGRLRELAARLDELYRQQRWDELSRRFDELDAETTHALDAARAAAANLQQLLDRRTELRGRLDAFKAMARGLGYAEDQQLTELHRQARELLWTAPCDLAAATRAVAAYQREILALKAGRREVGS